MEKLEELCFEGYYPSDYIKMSAHELGASLDVFDPILNSIYNDGEVYTDELRRGRSAFYSLPGD